MQTVENGNSLDFSSHEPPQRLPWADRNGFPGWLMGMGWGLAAFALFQIVAGIFAIVMLFATGRVTLDSLTESALFEHLDILFLSNTVGQVLFLGLMTWYVTRLSVAPEQRASFLRIRSDSNTLKNTGLAFLLLIVIQPVIYFLSWVNMQYPFSESYLQFDESQMRLLQNLFTGDHLLVLTLFHIALVPAICEEVLFRGYILRNFEKSMTPWVAIILSGLIFGLFHVRLTQFIPLATLGMMLAWMTIVTRSLWPAIIAHLVNNGGSALFATWFPEIAFDESLKNTMPPLYLVGLSVILTYFILRTMRSINQEAEGPVKYVQQNQT